MELSLLGRFLPLRWTIRNGREFIVRVRFRHKKFRQRLEFVFARELRPFRSKLPWRNPEQGSDYAVAL